MREGFFCIQPDMNTSAALGQGKSLSPELQQAYHAALEDYQERGEWSSLERAHVLSQAYAWPHTYVHWRMFVFALQQRNAAEILGQFARLLLAAPGSWLGRAPVGNTGGANVGIFTPMPIPPELRAVLLTDQRSARFLGETSNRQDGPAEI
jgi:hypothetical protein